MIPRLIAGLVVVGLAIGVWALWPESEPDPSPTTLVDAVDSTTSTSITGDTSTPTTVETHVVTTVEEAEAILRQLWFGWFKGIYNQDEERIKAVVASQTLLDSARTAFGSLAFGAAPTIEGVVFAEIEVLLSSEACLVVWSRSDALFLQTPEGVLRDGVDVLRWASSGWVMASSWQNRNDLWEADCGSVLEPLS